MYLEYQISSKAFGMFNVEIYHTVDGQLLGGHMIAESMTEYHRVIPFDGTFKIDTGDSILLLTVDKENKISKCEVQHLRSTPQGRVLISTEIKDVDICLDKITNQHAISKTLIDIVKRCHTP